MTTHVVFDLDGTLADTRDLVRRAYDLVGVHMPEHAWGLPAEAWLAAHNGRATVPDARALPAVAEEVSRRLRVPVVGTRTVAIEDVVSGQPILSGRV